MRNPPRIYEICCRQTIAKYRAEDQLSTLAEANLQDFSCHMLTLIIFCGVLIKTPAIHIF